MSIDVRLTAAPAWSEERLSLTIEMINRGETDLLLLAWGTPLEGLVSDCLLVLRDGVEVAYDGPLVKRGEPQAGDFVQIRAGKTVSRSVDLATAYKISGAAVYSIELRPWSAPILEADADPTPYADLSVSTRLALPQVPLPIELEVDDSFSPATSGERARAQEKQHQREADTEAGMVVGAAKAPTFTGGSATEQDQTRSAHIDGYNLATRALSSLGNNAKYVEWFGAYTGTRFSAAQTVYTKIKVGMETKTLRYDLTGAGCEPGWYAYTHKGTTTVWMCSAFWKAPATGTNSKAGTVLHEWSHALANTSDIRYGQASCRELARTEPDKAVANADSFEYYAGG